LFFCRKIVFEIVCCWSVVLVQHNEMITEYNERSVARLKLYFETKEICINQAAVDFQFILKGF
jgi:hypothetical protein